VSVVKKVVTKVKQGKEGKEKDRQDLKWYVRGRQPDAMPRPDSFFFFRFVFSFFQKEASEDNERRFILFEHLL
jgi:hypothetical protein